MNTERRDALLAEVKATIFESVQHCQLFPASGGDYLLPAKVLESVIEAAFVTGEQAVHEQGAERIDATLARLIAEHAEAV